MAERVDLPGRAATDSGSGRLEEQDLMLEKATMKFLRRYLDEKEQTFKNFAKVVRSPGVPAGGNGLGA